MLKLTIQGIEAKDLFDTGTFSAKQSPAVIFKIGGKEFSTERYFCRNYNFEVCVILYL